MPAATPIGSTDYYELFPSIEHRPGDIWTGLPTFGTLPFEHTGGVVITPACDLQNDKADTLTWLPLIPIRAVFALTRSNEEFMRTVEGQSNILGIPVDMSQITNSEPVDSTLVDGIVEGIRRFRASKQILSDKERTAVERLASCLTLIQRAGLSLAEVPEMVVVRAALGESAYDGLARRVVRNSYKSDVHFLPSDQQRDEWSGIPEHSIVLFRNVLSAPICLFRAAQDSMAQDWVAECGRLSAQCLAATSFANQRPLKRLTMKPRFFADLLTRYLGMLIRLGSPDFSAGTVDRYVTELGEK